MIAPAQSDGIQKSWFPHKYSWTETPFLFLLAKLIPYWTKIRNILLRNPLFEWRIPFPCFQYFNRCMTLGEMIVFLVCVGSTVAFCVLSFIVNADVEATGVIAIIPLVLTFMLASHNSIFTFLLGIPFERALFWHKLAALSSVATGWTHGVLALMDNNNKNTKNGKKEKDDDDDEIVSGLVFTIAMSMFIVLSLAPIRRFLWNGFYIVHIILVLVTIPSGLIHGAGVFMIGVGIWLFDVVFRYVYLAALRNPHKSVAKRLPANVVRLTFQKDHCVYSPGQYAFIMVPKVSIWEWHPFSFSSSPHHKQVSFHIRVLGNWTKRLYERVKSESDLTVYIEGPYGAPEVDVDGEKYKMFLMISGGIGITPLQSICNYLIYQKEKEQRPIKKVWFAWSCADKYMVSATFEHDREWAGISNQNTNRLPTSFQPDDLEKLDTIPALAQRSRESLKTIKDNPQVLHTEFYLTRVRPTDGYGDANIRPELQPYVKFGRPNLEEIFVTMRACAQLSDEKHIATMTCG